MKKAFSFIAAALLGLVTIGCQELEEQKNAAFTQIGRAVVRLAMDLAEAPPSQPKAAFTASTPERRVKVIAFGALDEVKLDKIRAAAARARAKARVARFQYEFKLEVCPKRASNLERRLPARWRAGGLPAPPSSLTAFTYEHKLEVNSKRAS